MTILAIDGVGAKHGGASTVLCAVVDAALRSESVSRVIVFCSPARYRRFALPTDPRLSVVECGGWTESPVGRFVWMAGGFERGSRQRGAAALLALNGGGLERKPRSAHGTVVIQQSLPFWPERRRYFGLWAEPRFRMIKWSMRQGCQRARRVVVQSVSMRDTVSREFELDRAKVVVLPPDAPRVEVETEGRCDISPNERSGAIRLLYVGNSTRPKNLEIAAMAVSLLRMDAFQVELVATIEPDHGLCRSGTVTPLGYLDRSTMAKEFAKADVLVMPSLIETVGLPMLEAMARGLPVVAADRNYAHDLCGSAAVYFDPLDEEALANALRGVLVDAMLWKRLRAAGLARAAQLRNARPYDRLIELAIAS